MRNILYTGNDKIPLTLNNWSKFDSDFEKSSIKSHIEVITDKILKLKELKISEQLKVTNLNNGEPFNAITE